MSAQCEHPSFRSNLSSERPVYMPPFASPGFGRGEAPYAPLLAGMKIETPCVSLRAVVIRFVWFVPPRLPTLSQEYSFGHSNYRPTGSSTYTNNTGSRQSSSAYIAQHKRISSMIRTTMITMLNLVNRVILATPADVTRHRTIENPTPHQYSLTRFFISCESTSNNVLDAHSNTSERVLCR